MSKLNVPDNASVRGNNWYCNAGYRQSGNKCLKLNVPDNASVRGNNWYCNAGVQTSQANKVSKT